MAKKKVSKSLGMKKIGDPYNRNDSLSKRDYTKEAATRNQMGPRKVPSGNDAMRARGAALGGAKQAAKMGLGAAMRGAAAGAARGAVTGGIAGALVGSAAGYGYAIGSVAYKANAAGIQDGLATATDYIKRVKSGSTKQTPKKK